MDILPVAYTTLINLIDMLPGYAYCKDAEGSYITANKAFCELFQVPGDIRGEKDRDILPADKREAISGLESGILAGDLDQGESETIISGKSGDIVIVWRIVPYRDDNGSITGVIGIGYDITCQKAEEAGLWKYAELIDNQNAELTRLHDELARVNKNLDLQVRERTREVEALLVQKDHFIGQLGHDLRSPLIPLVGLIPFLIEQERDPDIVRLLLQMESSITVMQRTVEQIVNLARLNSMYYITDQKTYDLAELAGCVVDEFEQEAGNSGIDITIDIPEGITVKLSPIHAHDILRHLLSNAIRYNNPGGYIHISAIPDDDTVTVIVKDNGIGIEEADISRIFEEFYRADKSRQNLDAKGLGLAIVRRMVVLDEGKVWAESDGPGRGSTFYLRFPRGDHQTWLVS